jgi:hypothetical protein
MATIERGYNRDGDNLSQFNIGVFCDEETKIPLYYNRYNGSLTDRTNLCYVLDHASTVGMPAHLKTAKEFINAEGEGMKVYANQLVSYPTIYCTEIKTKTSGVEGKVLLYFDARSHLNSCEDLSTNLERLKSELSALKRYPKGKLKRYSKYFKISKTDSGFDFEVDQKRLKKYGNDTAIFCYFQMI